MLRRLGVSPCVLMVLGSLLFTGECAVATEPLDFNRDIRPILSDKCFRCHGPDEHDRKGSEKGLRLDVESAAKADLGGYFAIVAGKPADSEFVRRIQSTDADDIMPPKTSGKKLTPEQIAKLVRWIEEGADYKQHWAFVPPQANPLPTIQLKTWPKNEIDSFILARLEQAGLQPSPQADRYTLIRRAYLDLSGIPPTPAEADAFVNDASPEAFEKVVDALLKSPRYGERWARRWLDLARYADTNGYEKDRGRTMWPYRDWVIQALNDDMPFDQFTIRQLAGDMLPNATTADRIATGFHRNTMLNEEGGIDPLEFRYYAMVDRVNTTASAWLGLTVGCAQCHTHKYDPITHTEYYRLFAMLNNADEPELIIPAAGVETKRPAIEQQIAALEADLPNQFKQNEVVWTTGQAAALVSEGKATVELQDDQSFRISGESPEKDSYTITFKTGEESFDRLQLETLLDGDAGPGRTPHGNFVLSEINITAAPVDEPEKSITVKITQTKADFSQKLFPVENAIDGNLLSGWAVDGDGRKPRTATFTFEKPVRFAKGTAWTIKLEQQHGSQHTIARLRVKLGRPAESTGSQQERQRQAFEQAFKTWEQNASQHAASWHITRPREVKSSLPLFTILADNSVLTSGDISKRDVLEVTLPVDLPQVTAVRLEAIPDPSLPSGGPGRIYYEGPKGDFYLSEIIAETGGQPAKFASAQHSFASGNFHAKNAIDGDPQTGWSINGGQGKDHQAVFVLAEPLKDAKELKIRLVFERYYAPTIGRFRLSLSSDPQAAKSSAWPADVEAALAVPREQRSAEQTAIIQKHFLALAPELADARKKIEGLRNQLKSHSTAMVMQEWQPGAVRPTTRYHRGEYLQPKETVQPGVPAFLPPLPKEATANRLALAQWLVSRENPLTARVVVNRQWQAFFGRGLVRTLEDFGSQGELPSHPELLDYLAVRFMEEGWSMKKLHKLIVMSATYQQTSDVSPRLLERDAANVLLARGPRVRMEAELIRDSALHAAGLLSPKMLGPSVFPPQPASVTTEGTYGSFAWNASQGEDRYRRSLYTFTKRTAPFALYATFDAPSGEACLVRREVSNSPLQGLSLMNDVVFLETSQALGRAIAGSEGTTEQKLSVLFRRCLTRPPSEQEQKRLLQYLARQRARLLNKEIDAKAIAGESTGDIVDQAAWTLVARAILNLDEAVTKN